MERLRAVETELCNAMVDLAWAMNSCECKHCRQASDWADRRAKADYN